MTDLSYENGQVTAWVADTKFQRVADKPGILAKKTKVDLSGFDVILMRQDPPFDMQYIAATHLLERLHPKTYVVNNPAAVRNAPEKLFVTQFAQFMPPTLITIGCGCGCAVSVG